MAKTQSKRSVPLAQFADGCIQCHSKDNERCATDPLSLLNRNCSDGTSNCYSRILSESSYLVFNFTISKYHRKSILFLLVC